MISLPWHGFLHILGVGTAGKRRKKVSLENPEFQPFKYTNASACRRLQYEKEKGVVFHRQTSVQTYK